MTVAQAARLCALNESELAQATEACATWRHLARDTWHAMQSSSMQHTRRTLGERVKRGAIIAAVIVLLGVVTTYLVAWVAVSLITPDTLELGWWTRLDVGGQSWAVNITSESKYELSGILQPCERHSFSRCTTVVPPEVLPNDEIEVTSRDFRIAGWPLHCVWGAGEWRYFANAPPWANSRRPFVHCSPVLWSPHASGQGRPGIDGRLPLGVIWSRFIPNVLIHAAILFTFWRGCVFMSRWSKRHRYTRQNRCPTCGYDLKGLPPGTLCPECGMSTKGGAGVASVRVE